MNAALRLLPPRKLLFYVIALSEKPNNNSDAAHCYARISAVKPVDRTSCLAVPWVTFFFRQNEPFWEIKMLGFPASDANGHYCCTCQKVWTVMDCFFHCVIDNQSAHAPPIMALQFVALMTLSKLETFHICI